MPNLHFRFLCWLSASRIIIIAVKVRANFNKNPHNNIHVLWSICVQHFLLHVSHKYINWLWFWPTLLMCVYSFFLITTKMFGSHTMKIAAIFFFQFSCFSHEYEWVLKSNLFEINSIEMTKFAFITVTNTIQKNVPHLIYATFNFTLKK